MLPGDTVQKKKGLVPLRVPMLDAVPVMLRACLFHSVSVLMSRHLATGRCFLFIGCKLIFLRRKGASGPGETGSCTHGGSPSKVLFEIYCFCIGKVTHLDTKLYQEQRRPSLSAKYRDISSVSSWHANWSFPAPLAGRPRLSLCSQDALGIENLQLMGISRPTATTKVSPPTPQA